MLYILYNSLSNNGRGKEEAERISVGNETDVKYVDVISVTDYHEFFETIGDSKLILSGGDGTLNNFINKLPDEYIERDIYYYPAGSGNDFANDIELKKEDGPVLLTPYIKHLPTVTFKGITRKFFNNASFGLDGYCCEKGDEHRKKSDKPVNYTTIALKGLLYDYKPGKVHIEADGKQYDFDNVWMAPAMNGRFLGGGMMITPMQDRCNKEHTVTLVAVHNKSRLRILTLFPKIFKGAHVGYNDVVEFKEHVKHAVIEFESPTSVQIDGETYLNVKKIEVNTSAE